MNTIAIARIAQETCSFNPIPTTLRDFEWSGLHTGAAVLNTNPGEGNVIGGFLETWRPEAECLRTGLLSTAAMSGGPLAASTFASLRARLLAEIDRAGPFPLLFIALHGAMAAEDVFDTEGALLTDLRQRLGPHVFICVSLDHHANVTPAMVEAADVMIGYETQPHNQRANGAKTARVMADIRDARRTPRAALVKIPMLAPQDNFLTSGGPMKAWFDRAREMEQDPAVIAVSVFPTQPWLDVPDNGWSCLVYADAQATAQRYAEELAQVAWDLRERFWHSERLSVPDAVRAAQAEPRGLVIFSDTGDATFGGAPGDNMTLAAEMLKQELRGPALVPVVDPEAYTAAVQAGIGCRVTLPIGGRMSAGFSPRPTLTATVRAVAEPGVFSLAGRGNCALGAAVLLECGPLKLVIMANRDHSINHPALYARLGIDVGQAHSAVLKTGSNFQAFDSFRSRLIRVDSPGATQSDLNAFTWRNRPRPLYPFEDRTDWRDPS